jgi:hypothetical protein
MGDTQNSAEVMSDEELEAVAGGGGTNGSIPGHNDNCNCDQC